MCMTGSPASSIHLLQGISLPTVDLSYSAGMNRFQAGDRVSSCGDDHSGLSGFTLSCMARLCLYSQPTSLLLFRYIVVGNCKNAHNSSCRPIKYGSAQLHRIAVVYLAPEVRV